MKHSIFLLLSFCFLNFSHASEPHVVEEPAWKANPCLVKLADEVAQKTNISFRFRNAVSLRSTAIDPRCDEKVNENDGISWKCSYEIAWSAGIGRNVLYYGDKRFGITYPDLREFFLAEESVKADKKMWPLWQVLFAKKTPT